MAAISVAIYAPEGIVEFFEQSSSWILDKFLGEVPRLESLIGWADFTKVRFFDRHVCEVDNLCQLFFFF